MIFSMNSSIGARGFSSHVADDTGTGSIESHGNDGDPTISRNVPLERTMAVVMLVEQEKIDRFSECYKPSHLT